MPQPQRYKNAFERKSCEPIVEFKFIAEEFGAVVWHFYFRRTPFKYQLRAASSISTVLDLCQRTHSLLAL